MEIEIELKSGIIVNVEFHAKAVDASFSHAFGIEKVTDYEMLECIIKDFEEWDEDGENVIRTAPTAEEIEEIETLAFEKFLENVK